MDGRVIELLLRAEADLRNVRTDVDRCPRASFEHELQRMELLQRAGGQLIDALRLHTEDLLSRR